jgi:hypothetical protein
LKLLAFLSSRPLFVNKLTSFYFKLSLCDHDGNNCLFAEMDELPAPADNTVKNSAAWGLPPHPGTEVPKAGLRQRKAIPSTQPAILVKRRRLPCHYGFFRSAGGHHPISRRGCMRHNFLDIVYLNDRKGPTIIQSAESKRWADAD